MHYYFDLPPDNASAENTIPDRRANGRKRIGIRGAVFTVKHGKPQLYIERKILSNRTRHAMYRKYRAVEAEHVE